MTVERLIQSLQGFWGDEGCVALPPLDVEVGTSTMVPETFLALRRDEPLRTTRVQAIRRPADYRARANNLRVGRHLQFSVVLRPAPADPEALLLSSLERIGLELALHDVQIVDDDWIVPLLGVRGSGWVAALDGVKIARAGLLSEAGGVALRRPTLELVYGLERLAVLEQGRSSIASVVWGGEMTYGALGLGDEGLSRFYFEEADVDWIVQLFDLYRTEAARALERGLVRPAYECVLRAAHWVETFSARLGADRLRAQEMAHHVLTLARECSMAAAGAVSAPEDTEEARG